MFDNARQPHDLDFTKSANADKTPVNEDISIASGITITVTQNEFANGKSDGLVLAGKIPVGTDTSIPLVLEVDWYAKTAAVTDVELEIEVAKVTNGFIYDGTGTKSAPQTVITTLDNVANKRKVSQFTIGISDMLIGDTLVISLFRDATAGNTDDTYAGSVVLSGQRITGYKWR